jgi:hypothetical protein
MDYIADGDKLFEVTIKTGDEDDAGYSSRVLVEILGSDADSGYKILDESGYEQGTSLTRYINIRDIGEITGFRLKIGPVRGNWKPKTIVITNVNSGETKPFEITSELSSEGKTVIKQNLDDGDDDDDDPINSNQASTLTPTGDNPIEGIKKTGKTAAEERETIDLTNPFGGLLDIYDRNSNLKFNLRNLEAYL